MSELTTFLEERKKQRYEILEGKIKELEAKIKEEKTENDNVDELAPLPLDPGRMWHTG